MIPETFHKLPQTCPATLWSAIGYSGSDRFLGLYWDPTEDEAAWWDGTVGLKGANWWAYIQLTDHLFPPGNPNRYSTGSSDNCATHWIILDKQTESIYLAPIAPARTFLAAQWAFAHTGELV